MTEWQSPTRPARATRWSTRMSGRPSPRPTQAAARAPMLRGRSDRARALSELAQGEEPQFRAAIIAQCPETTPRYRTFTYLVIRQDAEVDFGIDTRRGAYLVPCVFAIGPAPRFTARVYERCRTKEKMRMTTIPFVFDCSKESAFLMNRTRTSASVTSSSWRASGWKSRWSRTWWRASRTTRPASRV